MQMLMLQAMEIKKQRDPLLDNKAVMKHREIIHLRANHIQRELIAGTVSESERGLRIWEGVLVEYMAQGRNPKDVTAMLKHYRATIDGLIGASR
jgi:hypothetical protein